MGNKSTLSNYFGVGYNFSTNSVAAGTVITCPEDVKRENVLRVVSDSVVGDYIIQGSLIGQSAVEDIYVGTGTIDTTLDISLYDRIFIKSSSDLTAGQLAVSAFYMPSVPLGSGGANGDATAANQVAGNAILSNILTEVSDDVECAETPTIYNEAVTGGATIYNVLLPVNCKRFLIRHRDAGSIEFAFSATLSTYMTIRKGVTFSQDGLCLANSSLYFRSDKTGTVEILAWT